jgi:hypothetical protein
MGAVVAECGQTSGDCLCAALWDVVFVRQDSQDEACVCPGRLA